MGVTVWQVRRANEPGVGAAADAAPSAGVAGETLAAAAGTPRPAVAVRTAGDVDLHRAAAERLSVLRQRVAACTACPLHETRTQTVFGVGNSRARCMIVGEAPGADEDRRGEPFVGRAGQLLNAMLAAIGLSRDDVFIANILKCRPPRNRDPRPQEVACCSGFLREQVETIAPRVLVAVGRIAAQNLLGTTESLGRLRGRLHEHADTGTPVLVTYHPAYLLRTPADKAKAWQDLRRLRALLAEQR